MKMTFEKFVGVLANLKNTKGIEVLDAEGTSLCPFCPIHAINFTIKKDCSVNIEFVCNNDELSDSNEKPLRFNIEDGAFNGDNTKRDTVISDINARIDHYYGVPLFKIAGDIGPGGFDTAITISHYVIANSYLVANSIESISCDDDRLRDVDIDLSIDFYGTKLDILDDSSRYSKMYVNAYADKMDCAAKAIKYLPHDEHKLDNKVEYRTVIHYKDDNLTFK